MEMSASMTMEAVLPEGWERAKGFAFGMCGEGQMVFVSGQLAGKTGALAPASGMDFADQFLRCLAHVAAVVRAAGGGPSDIAMLRAFVTDMDAYKASQSRIAEGWRTIMGRHFPAMTMVEVRALYEETAMVEIEATAVLRKEAAS